MHQALVCRQPLPSSHSSTQGHLGDLLKFFLRIVTWLFFIGGMHAHCEESNNSKGVEREQKQTKNSLPAPRPEIPLVLVGGSRFRADHRQTGRWVTQVDRQRDRAQGPSLVLTEEREIERNRRLLSFT